MRLRSTHAMFDLVSTIVSEGVSRLRGRRVGGRLTITGPEDLEGLRRIGAIVAAVRDAMLKEAREGISTAELDEIGGKLLESHGARSAPQLAYNFPGYTCISVNDQLAHGVPSPTKILKAGDLVNIDVSAELDGYWADTGASTAVGQIRPQLRKLLWSTQSAQREAMQLCCAGRSINSIGQALEKKARKAGFRIVKSLTGHGVGRHIHELPTIPNVYDAQCSMPLWEGLVITIEPFFTLGATDVVQESDGWTLRTPDGSVGAQFEHTFVVTKGMPIILT